MKSITLTNPKYNGHIELSFNENKQLVKLDMMQAELRIDQLENFVRELLPFHQDDLKALPKGFNVVTADYPVEFMADFWKPYRKKVNLQRCIPLFAKLAKSDMVEACIKQKEYFKCCDRTGRKVADPETYLKLRYWETDWKTI